MKTLGSNIALIALLMIANTEPLNTDALRTPPKTDAQIAAYCQQYVRTHYKRSILGIKEAMHYNWCVEREQKRRAQ